MKENNALLGQPIVRNFHFLKLISAIIYVAVTMYLILGLKNALNDDGLGIAAFLVFGVIILGSIGNVLAITPALIGLIYTAIKYKVVPKKTQLVIFAVQTALPIITELLFIIIVSNI